MRLSPACSLQPLLAATAADVTMSSSPRFPPSRAWRRSLSDLPSGASGRGDPRPPFVSGDSHLGAVRDSNYRFRRGPPLGDPRFRPPPIFRPPPRPRPDDFRSWENALAQPPPSSEQFVVVSYNILADYLAKEHRYKLYFHIPPYVLDWEWRKKRIMIELRLWSPDIMCLQEVDRFQNLAEELKLQGYHGIWKMRPGPPVDGCAIFWRTSRFSLLHEEHIEFDKLELRNNVAQICVLESRRSCPSENVTAASSTSFHSGETNQVVVCNIHVLYNPNRGDIKIGQVRVLLDRAHAVSRTWNDAPVVVCGDFNCIPKSPLYKFISEQKLNLSGLAKNQVSGQYSASIYVPEPNNRNNESSLPSNYLGVCNSDQLSVPTSNEVGTVQQHGFLSGTHNQNSLLNDFAGKERKQPQNTSIGSSCEHDSQCRLDKNVFEETLGSNDEQVEPSCKSPESHVSSSVVATLQKRYDDVDEEGMHLISAVSSFEESVTSEMHVSEGKANSTASNQSHCAKKFADFSPGRTGQPRQEVESLGRDSSIGGSEVLQSCSNETVSDFDAGYENERPESSGRDCSTSGSDVMQFGRAENLSAFGDSYKIERPSSSESNQSLIEYEASNEIQGVKHQDLASGISQSSPTRSREVSDPSAEKYIPEKETIFENRNDINSLAEKAPDSSPVDLKQPWTSLSSPEGHVVGKLAEVNFEMPISIISGESLLDHQSPEDVDDFSTSICPQITEVERKPYDPYVWTPTEIATASGNADCTVAEHQLKLKSTYTEVEDYAGTKDLSREPQVTSYNRRFMGTVDYIWCSDGLQTVAVLDTIPRHILQRTPGLPTRKWGSDHLAIASRLAFVKGVQGKAS